MQTRTLALASALIGSTLALDAAWAQTQPAPPPANPNAATAPGSPDSSAPTAAGVPTAPGTSGSTSGTGAPSSSTANITSQMTVDAVEDMDLVTAAGAEVGDIEGVVENTADKKQFLVVKRGGFLWFGGKEVAVPLDNVGVRNGKVVLRGMDVAQVEAMPEFRKENNAYRELDDTQQVSLAQLQ